MTKHCESESDLAHFEPMFPFYTPGNTRESLPLWCFFFWGGEGHKMKKLARNGLKNHCVKCPNTKLFLVRIFLYSVRIEENTDQK